MDAQATFSYSSTQSDVGSVTELPGLPHCAAQRLLPQERRNLAIQVLAGAQPISDLAHANEVRRKFLCPPILASELWAGGQSPPYCPIWDSSQRWITSMT